jgi:cytochrome c oxidase subunit 4
MSAQVTSKKIYFGVFGALIFGTIVTILAARVDLGALNTPVALLIAAAKASLVVWYFMEVRHVPGLTKIAALAGIFGLAVLLIFVLSDYISRNWLPGPLAW